MPSGPTVTVVSSGAVGSAASSCATKPNGSTRIVCPSLKPDSLAISRAGTVPMYSVEPSGSVRAVRPFMPSVTRFSVVPPTSSRRADWYSSGVVPLPGSMFFLLPIATQCPLSIVNTRPLTTTSGDPGLPFRPGVSLETTRSSPCQRIVEPAHSLPSWVMRTTAVPDCSAEAALRAAAFWNAAVALGTPDEPIVENATTAIAATAAAPMADRPTKRRRERRGRVLSEAPASSFRTTRAAVSTVSAKAASFLGLARRRAWMLSGVLMDPPSGNIGRGARRGAAELFEDRPEPAPRPVQPTSRGHRQAAEDSGDLRGRQVLPLREEQDLAIARAEAGERL